MKATPPRAETKPTVSLHTWFTRADAGRVLEITASGVRALEVRGKLRAVIDGEGTHRFNPADVHEFALRRKRRKGRADTSPPREGALEARVFELLDLYNDGGERDTLKMKRIIVRELGITGEEFGKYYEDWITPPDEQVRTKRRAEREAVLAKAKREEAELTARFRLEELRTEREEKRRDAEFLKELRRRGPYSTRSKDITASVPPSDATPQEDKPE